MLLYVALDRRADAKARMGKSQLKGLWNYLKILAEIFVAGYKAVALGNNQWSYWAPNGGLVKVNIIADGKIWQSYSFRSQKKKTTIYPSEVDV